MYQGFASHMNWAFELLNYTDSDYGTSGRGGDEGGGSRGRCVWSSGGLHHAAARISGENVYRRLKHEGGTHRVQRIPEVGLSSRMQRIHTGTMTVIVLPQPAEVDPPRGVVV